MITRSTSPSAGRASKNGETIRRTPVTQPDASTGPIIDVLWRRTVAAGDVSPRDSFEPEPLHAVTQLAKRDAKQLRSGSPVVACPEKRSPNRLRFQMIKICRQLRRDALHQVERHCWRFGAFAGQLRLRFEQQIDLGLRQH